MNNFFPENLAFLRKAAGLSQAEMLTATGFKRTTWNGYEKGTSKPNFDDLLKIAEFFDVSLSALIENQLFTNSKKGEDYDFPNIFENTKKGKDSGKDSGKDLSVKGQNSEVSAAEFPYHTDKYNVYDFAGAAAAGVARLLVPEDKYRTAPNLYLPDMGQGLHIRVPIAGDSMEGRFHDGDKAVATHVTEMEDIRYGHAYVIFDKADGIIIKRLYKLDKNHFEIVSDNTLYKPYKRHLNDIIAVFRVVEIHSRNLTDSLEDVKTDVRILFAAFEDLRRSVLKD